MQAIRNRLRFTRSPQTRAGFTMTEMMVVVLITGIVSVGLYQVLTASRNSYEQQKVTLEMQQNARVAIQALADDFRHVSYGKDPTQPSIDYAGPDSVAFIADVLPDIPGAEEIGYALSSDGDPDTPNPNDTVLMKTVRDSSGTLLYREPQSYGIGNGGLSFQYFNGAGVALPNPVPHPEQIGEVMIEVTAVEPREHQRHGDYLEQTLSTTIYPRNLPLTPARSRPSTPILGTLAIPNCESVTIPWNTPTTNTDGTDLPLSEISHFTVYFGTDPDSMSLYCRVARTINQWTISDLTGGHHYYFGVTCTSRSGVESFPGQADLDLNSPRYPEAPGTLTWHSNPYGAGIELQWDPVTTFEDLSTITTPVDYHLYRAQTAGVTPTAGNRLATVSVSTSYIDSALVDCETYYYIVTAEACGNEGTASPEISVLRPAPCECVGPIDVALTEFNGEFYAAWQPPTARTDGSPLSPDEVTGYRIYYQLEPYLYETYVDVPGTTTEWVVTGVDDCETYYVNVAAIDECGHVGNVCSYNEVSVQTAEPCNPESPAGVAALSATASANRVDLGWPANSGDCDLRGYLVYYGSQAGGPYDGTSAAEGPSPILVESGDVVEGDSCRLSLHDLPGCETVAAVVRCVDNCDPGNQGSPSPEAVTETSCTPCNADAGCVAYLATGAAHGDVRLEVYPTDGLELLLAELTPDWSGPALVEQVWLGRPLVKIWDADGSAGADGSIGPQPSGVTLDLDNTTIPSYASQRDGLPLLVRFDRDQRQQSLGLTFATETGVCEAGARTIDSGVFFDDFDDGDYSGWNVISGTWAVYSGELYQGKDYGIRMILSPDEHTDVAYEAKIKVVDGYNPYVVFRYQDTANYYTWGIKTSTNQARFAKYENGSFVVTQQTSYYCTNNRWYLLRVEVCGNTARGYVDCEQILEVTDWDMVATGEIGLRTYAARIYADDVRVASLTSLP